MPAAAPAQVRSRCARIGFSGGKAETRVSELSGGEKARLLLGLATFAGPHLLIMDEPTNHLDIDSRAALMEAINDYEGAVILVSHDRYLIEACADRLWLVADGTVRPFDGDMDDYRRRVLAAAGSPGQGAREREEREESRAGKAEARREPPRSRRETAPLRRRLEAVDERMKRLHDLLARVDAALAAPDAFAKDQAKASALAQQRGELERALIAAEKEWLELTEAAERAEA